VSRGSGVSVTVNYNYQAVRILWLGTHREYDRINAREVQYDKRRYTDSADPNGEGPR
jgi:hypothetical protein